MTACCQIAGCSLFYGKTDISQAGIYSNAANSCLVCIGIACMLYLSVYACALVSIVLRCQNGMPGLFPVLFCDAEEPLPSAGTGSSASSYGLSCVAAGHSKKGSGQGAGRQPYYPLAYVQTAGAAERTADLIPHSRPHDEAGNFLAHSAISFVVRISDFFLCETL